MAQSILRNELSEVRKAIVGTHGLKRPDGTRAVIYYVFKISNDIYGALWYAGLNLYPIEFLLKENPGTTFPFAYKGTRKEVAVFCKKDILNTFSRR